MRRKRSVVTSRQVIGRGIPSSARRSAPRPGARAAFPARPGRGSPAAPRSVDLAVDLAPERPGGLRLAHPLLVAAGGGGYGVELTSATGALTLPAAIVTRGTTTRAHPGAEPPRMAATQTGLVSAIGSPNPGVVRALEQYAPRWAAWDVPVVLALCAEDAAGFAALARAVDGRSGVAGLELHLGCRDVRGRRRSSATDAARDAHDAASICAAVRAETDLPILAKVGTTGPDPGEVAAAAVDGGADAIAAIGGVPAACVDPVRRRAALGSDGGVLSGPAILPISLRAVAQVSRAVRVPVIGIGGVATLGDVLEMLMAGASAVGMATAVLGDPTLPGRLALELEAWCRSEGVVSVSELVGVASPGSFGRTRRR